MSRGGSGSEGGGTLRADVLVRRRRFMLDARLEVAPGEVVAVIGHNGAGKSTLLQALAGLVPLASGFVRVGERMLSSTHHVVPVHQRRVGLLGQDPMLFPHLNALRNVAFAHRTRGLNRQDSKTAAQGDLAAVGLQGLEQRRPAELSGGQQQRVALMRALAARPDVVLLDEPLAAVDAQSARRLRTDLRRFLTGSRVPTVVVTHDIADVRDLADRVIRLEDGRIAEASDVAATQVITAVVDGEGKVHLDVDARPGEQVQLRVLSPG